MPGYLGDTEKMIAHNLANTKNECNIYEIKIENRKYFMPDTLENTKSLGYKPCEHCN